MSTYSYSTDGLTWHSLTDAGFENLTRTRQNAEADTFTMRRSGGTMFTDESGAFVYNADIRIRQDSTQIFRGLVTSLPRYADHKDENQSVTISGPWAQLEKCTYQQVWASWTGSGVTNITKSRVILCQNTAGNRITMGAQIEDAIDWAISRGVAITKGVIDAGVQLPTDEKNNLKVAEVIHHMLRWFPDYVCWFDYSTDAPTFHCRKRSSLTAISKAITEGNLISLTPRSDRQVSGIHLTYELTHDEDGTVYKTTVNDTAGTLTAADTFYGTFDLEGSRRTYVRQKVATADFPSPITNTAWLKTLVPSIKDVADEDIIWHSSSVTKVDGGAANDQPRYLVQGAIPEWMNKTAVPVVANLNVHFRLKEGSDVQWSGIKNYKIELLATNATTRSYKRLTSYDSGETVPTGVADALFSTWNTLEFEGEFTFEAEEPAGSIGPGNAFNLTGGRGEWTTMSALVQSTIENYDAGSTTVRFGPPANLDADTLVALFRAFRSRRYSWSRTTRTTGTTDGESDVEMGGAAPEKNTTGESATYTRLRVKDTDADTHIQQVDIDPLAVAFAAPAHKSAQVIKPRERVVIYNDAGTLKAKLAQVLSSEVYGDGVPLAIGTPTNPTSPATIGETAEGSEPASTSTYTTATTGVQIHMLTRVVYNHAGDKKLYGYVRTLKFDHYGRLASISAETRHEIDVPE